MFRNPADEAKLYDVLRAYVEEWGPENVIIAVPAHWPNNLAINFGAVRLEFDTQSCISIRVEYDFIRLSYNVNLAPDFCHYLHAEPTLA